MSRSLDLLFNPNSVVVIGASANPSRPGHRFAKRLLESTYGGDVYLVNPSGGEILGHPIYGGLEEIEKHIDLALLMVAPERVEGAIEAIGKRGVPFAIVFTSGFGEIGQAGEEAQQRLINLARHYQVNLVGPNCMGLFNLNRGLNLTGTPNVPRGQFSIVSQSGNIGLTLFEEAKKFDIGFSKFVHFGNQADIALHEYLNYLGDDPDTAGIVMYVEGLKSETGRELYEVARRVSLHKPIVAIKAGRGSAAHRAAKSHTGALAGEAKLYSALFEQAGIIEVDRLDDLLPVAEALVRCPPAFSDDVAIIGSGGGHSVLLTDALETRGLRVPEFNDAVKSSYKSVLPDWAPMTNPVDMTGVFTGDLKLFQHLNRVTLEKQADFGAIVNYGLYGAWPAGFVADPSGNTYESVAPDFGKQQAQLDTPIVFYSPYAGSGLRCFKNMREAGVPAHDSIERAATCIEALRSRGKFLEKLRPSDEDFRLAATVEGRPSGFLDSLISKGKSRPTVNLTEPEVYEILNEYGVQVVPHTVTEFSADAALAAARAIDFPVVLKLVTPSQSHKSDIGGVVVDIRSQEELQMAFRRLALNAQSSALDYAELSLQVSQYMPGGTEVIAGFITDSQLGRILMVGAGGVLAEAMSRTLFRLLPLNEGALRDVAERAASLAVSRGRQPVAPEHLATLLKKLQTIALHHPDIRELELNPVLCFSDNVYAADARAFLEALSD